MTPSHVFENQGKEAAAILAKTTKAVTPSPHDRRAACKATAGASKATSPPRLPSTAQPGQGDKLQTSGERSSSRGEQSYSPPRRNAGTVRVCTAQSIFAKTVVEEGSSQAQGEENSSISPPATLRRNGQRGTRTEGLHFDTWREAFCFVTPEIMTTFVCHPVGHGALPSLPTRASGQHKSVAMDLCS